MSNKKQVFLSLETARQMWNGLIHDYPHINKLVELFLLDNFTKEELEAKELPKTWEELKKVSGYYINQYSEIGSGKDYSTSVTSKNTFPTKELAEASLALSQLLQLRDVYNGDWKVDLNNRPNETLFLILNKHNNIFKSDTQGGLNRILSFKKESIRDQFVENFKDLITQALPLL